MQVLLFNQTNRILQVSEQILEYKNFYIIEGTAENPKNIVPMNLSKIITSDVITTDDIGKYVDENNNIVIPETYDNPYNIPDSVYNEIKDESIAEVQSEVISNDNSETAATN